MLHILYDILSEKLCHIALYIIYYIIQLSRIICMTSCTFILDTHRRNNKNYTPKYARYSILFSSNNEVTLDNYNSRLVIRRISIRADQFRAFPFDSRHQRRMLQHRVNIRGLPYATTYFTVPRATIIYDRRRVTFFKHGKALDESAMSFERA